MESAFPRYMCTSAHASPENLFTPHLIYPLDNLAYEKSFRECLQGMEHPLTQERKSCPAIPHPFNQFELVHLALDETVVLGKGQSRPHCRFISFHAKHKGLEFADLTGFDGLEPVGKLLS